MTNGNLGNAVAGLMGVAILAGVAGSIMNKNRQKMRKPVKRSKRNSFGI
jgi:hypothetical protein